MPTLPPAMLHLLTPFAPLFARRVWTRALVLVAGALLTPGRRTVCAALRVMGLGQTRRWTAYHRVLNRAKWSSLAVSRVLLGLLVAAFAPAGPVVLGIDETIERRWGAKIAARGLYRDAVRSSKDYFVKVSGLRWLCLMLLVPLPWAGRTWALPFLTILAPSERHDRQRGRRHKKLTDWARQALLLLRRWLPGRALVVVADSGYAAIALLHRRRHPAAARRRPVRAGPAAPGGQMGRPRKRASACPPSPRASPTRRRPGPASPSPTGTRRAR
ncbi:MAG: transposase [Chloroflexia bacterium]